MIKYYKITYCVIAVLILFTVYNLAIRVERRKNNIKTKKIESIYKKETNSCNLAFKHDLYLLSQQSHYIDYSLIPEDMRYKPILVYTFAGGECGKCILEDVEAIKRKLNHFNISSVLILLTPSDDRIKDIAQISLLKELRHEWCEVGSIPFPLNSVGRKVRYFSLIMPDSCVILPFFPNNNYPNKTDIYLDFIFERFLN